MPRVNQLLEVTSHIASLVNSSKEDCLNEVCDYLKPALNCNIVSVYAVSDDGYTLVANTGFDRSHVNKLTLKKGSGLVNHIANTGKTLCLSEATAHLAFYYVHGLGEERYHGFIGTPIFRQQEIIGVLIFQFLKKYDSSLDDIALIETISHLISGSVKLPETKKVSEEKGDSRITARGVVQGFFVGPVEKRLIMEDSSGHDSTEPGLGYDIEKERFDEAYKKSKSFLEELKAKAHTKEAADILSAHLMMMQDSKLLEKIDGHLKENDSAEQAVTKATNEIADMFKSISDKYIQERAADVIDVGRRLYDTLCPKKSDDIAAQGGKVVCIANKMPPTVLIEEGPNKFGALILVEENLYSHNIILAKSMGIPTVIISRDQLMSLFEVESLFVDGELGLIVPNPSKIWVDEYTRSHHTVEESDYSHLGVCKTRNGTEITLAMNGGFQKDVENLPSWIPEIGLFRTEFQFFTSAKLPTEKQLIENYKKILSCAGKRPVTLRILDAGADKQPPCLHFVREENPVLGDRSIRFLLKNSEIIFTQLRAMLIAQHSTGGNLRILIPMVTAYEEVSRIRDHIIKVLRDLRREGLTLKRPPIGVMIEVPSSINLIHKLASMVDYFCVGTNDLLQYYVAADRTNSLVQYLYQWCHPAFLMTLKGISLSCTEAKKNVSICGEMAGEMWGSLILVGLGFRLLSMDRQVIARHHDLMAQANVKPLEKLVTKLIQCNTVLEVLEQMQLYLDKWNLPTELKDILQSELNNLIHPS